MPQESRLEITCRAGIVELAVIGVIGQGNLRAADFRDSLMKAAKDASLIRLRISSDGGGLIDALAIYAMLRSLNKRIEVVIEGFVASAATIIAMAGDLITMTTGSLMMIHLPGSSQGGTAAELRQTAEALDAFTNKMVEIYARRTRLPADKLLELMKREAFMTPEEAVKYGFADRIADSVKIAARVDGIRRMCAAAGKPEIADRYIDSKLSINAVFADLIGGTQHRPQQIDHRAIWARFNAPKKSKRFPK